MTDDRGKSLRDQNHREQRTENGRQINDKGPMAEGWGQG